MRQFAPYCVSMQTIGLLGGMSWVSTELYYRAINETIAERLGGSHSAKCLLHSFDFFEIEELQTRGAWSTAGRRLGEAARALRDAGADFFIICANTMHIVADEVERLGGAPVLHIGDATADALLDAGITKAGLLGTRYTMEKPFLREHLTRRGIEVIVPIDSERIALHAIIYHELIKNVVNEASRETCLAIIERLRADGAQGIILGCTELELLVTSQSTSAPVFQTAALHARAAALQACGVNGSQREASR